MNFFPCFYLSHSSPLSAFKIHKMKHKIRLKYNRESNERVWKYFLSHDSECIFGEIRNKNCDESDPFG